MSEILKEATLKIEKVMAHYGVVGVVAIADVNDNYYGLYVPKDAPLTLYGDNGIAIHPTMRKRPAFVGSLVRLRDAAALITDTVGALARICVSQLSDADREALRRSVEGGENP